MALYHAEIIDKIGAMIGGLTYGAKKSIALEHFDTSMQLAAEVPITAIENAISSLALIAQTNIAADIEAAIEILNDSTAIFAERRMDASIRTALSGQSVDEV